MVCWAIMGMASVTSVSSCTVSPFAGEPVVVELLAARRDQEPVQLLQIVAPQIRLLSVEQVYVLWGLCLQIRPQAIEAVVLFSALGAWSISSVYGH